MELVLSVTLDGEENIATRVRFFKTMINEVDQLLALCLSFMCICNDRHIFLLIACSAGWHGKNCKHRCLNWHCKQNTSCNHVTGLCEEGCAAGWKGSICDESNSISAYNFFFFSHNF